MLWSCMFLMVSITGKPISYGTVSAVIITYMGSAGSTSLQVASPHINGLGFCNLDASSDVTG